MIIVWKGAGWLVILIGIMACVLVNLITSAVFHQDNYFQAFLWPKVTALWIIGASCWFLGRYFNGQPGRTIIDGATGREVYERPYHHLMFIRMEYWGPIFFAFGLGLLVVRIAGR